jgi:hypothetical protein
LIKNLPKFLPKTGRFLDDLGEIRPLQAKFDHFLKVRLIFRRAFAEIQQKLVEQEILIFYTLRPMLGG